MISLLSLKPFFAGLAAVLAVAGNVPYLLDIVRGRVKPHPYTWFVWTIVSGIIFFGQLVKGAGVGAIPTFASEVFTLIIFIFSLRYGFQGIEWIDRVFLAAALFGVGWWVVTNDPTGSVMIAVAIDLVAFIPTLRKTWRFPETENSILYVSNGIRHGLALFSLEAYNVATTLHSISMIVVNSAMAIIMLTRGSVEK